MAVTRNQIRRHKINKAKTVITPDVSIEELDVLAAKNAHKRSMRWSDEDAAVLVKYYRSVPHLELAKYFAAKNNCVCSMAALRNKFQNMQ